MHSKSNFLILSTTALLLLVTKGVNSDLMCYVCDHCASVTANTPLLACDESFFNGGGTGLPSTMTTTELTGSTTEEDPTTMMPTTMTPTTTDSTPVPTTVSTTESTTTESSTTADPTTTESTEPKPPSPPTAGPVETTTALPTPPTQGTVMPVVEIVTQDTMGQNETLANATTVRNYMNSTTFRVRQQRAAVESMMDSVTYHCYSARFTANKTVNTERGCSRVTTEESVCQQLQVGISNGTSVSKCQFCHTNRCNSSSTLGVSIVAVIIGLVASLVKRS